MFGGKHYPVNQAFYEPPQVPPKGDITKQGAATPPPSWQDAQYMKFFRDRIFNTNLAPGERRAWMGQYIGWRRRKFDNSFKQHFYDQYRRFVSGLPVAGRQNFNQHLMGKNLSMLPGIREFLDKHRDTRSEWELFHHLVNHPDYIPYGKDAKKNLENSFMLFKYGVLQDPNLTINDFLGDFDTGFLPPPGPPGHLRNPRSPDHPWWAGQSQVLRDVSEELLPMADGVNRQRTRDERPLRRDYNYHELLNMWREAGSPPGPAKPGTSYPESGDALETNPGIQRHDVIGSAQDPGQIATRRDIQYRENDAVRRYWVNKFEHEYAPRDLQPEQLPGVSAHYAHERWIRDGGFDLGPLQPASGAGVAGEPLRQWDERPEEPSVDKTEREVILPPMDRIHDLSRPEMDLRVDRVNAPINRGDIDPNWPRPPGDPGDRDDRPGAPPGGAQQGAAAGGPGPAAPGAPGAPGQRPFIPNPEMREIKAEQRDALGLAPGENASEYASAMSTSSAAERADTFEADLDRVERDYRQMRPGDMQTALQEMLDTLMRIHRNTRLTEEQKELLMAQLARLDIMYQRLGQKQLSEDQQRSLETDQMRIRIWSEYLQEPPEAPLAPPEAQQMAPERPPPPPPQPEAPGLPPTRPATEVPITPIAIGTPASPAEISDTSRRSSVASAALSTMTGRMAEQGMREQMLVARQELREMSHAARRGAVHATSKEPKGAWHGVRVTDDRGRKFYFRFSPEMQRFVDAYNLPAGLYDQWYGLVKLADAVDTLERQNKGQKLPMSNTLVHQWLGEFDIFDELYGRRQNIRSFKDLAHEVADPWGTMQKYLPDRPGRRPESFVTTGSGLRPQDQAQHAEYVFRDPNEPPSPDRSAASSLHTARPASEMSQYPGSDVAGQGPIERAADISPERSQAPPARKRTSQASARSQTIETPGARESSISGRTVVHQQPQAPPPQAPASQEPPPPPMHPQEMRLSSLARSSTVQGMLERAAAQRERRESMETRTVSGATIENRDPVTTNKIAEYDIQMNWEFTRRGERDPRKTASFPVPTIKLGEVLANDSAILADAVKNYIFATRRHYDDQGKVANPDPSRRNNIPMQILQAIDAIVDNEQIPVLQSRKTEMVHRRAVFDTLIEDFSDDSHKLAGDLQDFYIALLALLRQELTSQNATWAYHPPAEKAAKSTIMRRLMDED